mmetsp:Transcript_59662/g.129202  ORF Transcript_59662/g.129202 Transcript_59662/m.129202 type:complete len:80 (-) Transcript_59662:625-864(-)
MGLQRQQAYSDDRSSVRGSHLAAASTTTVTGLLRRGKKRHFYSTAAAEDKEFPLEVHDALKTTELIEAQHEQWLVHLKH